MLNLFLFLSIGIAKPQKRNDGSLEPTTSAAAAGVRPKCGWKPKYKTVSSFRYCRNPDILHSMKWIYIGIDMSAIKSQRLAAAIKSEAYKSNISINKDGKWSEGNRWALSFLVGTGVAAGLMMNSLKYDPHNTSTMYVTDQFGRKTGREMSEIYIGISLASLAIITPTMFAITGNF